MEHSHLNGRKRRSMYLAAFLSASTLTVVGVFMVGNRSKSSMPARAMAPRRSSDFDENGLVTAVSAPSSFSESGSSAVASPPAPAESDAGPGDLSAQVGKVQSIQTKGLPTHYEREVLHDILSDPKVIAHAKQYLIEARPTQLEPEDVERRLGTVSLLAEALRWKDNPVRATVVSAFKDIILSDTYHHTDDPRVRKSLAADRYELYMALANSLPDEAKRLLEASENSPNAKLLRHAALVFANLNRP